MISEQLCDTEDKSKDLNRFVFYYKNILQYYKLYTIQINAALLIIGDFLRNTFEQ